MKLKIKLLLIVIMINILLLKNLISLAQANVASKNAIANFVKKERFK